jgi:hypothetical protein
MYVVQHNDESDNVINENIFSSVVFILSFFCLAESFIQSLLPVSTFSTYFCHQTSTSIDIDVEQVQCRCIQRSMHSILRVDIEQTGANKQGERNPTLYDSYVNIGMMIGGYLD